MAAQISTRALESSASSVVAAVSGTARQRERAARFTPSGEGLPGDGSHSGGRRDGAARPVSCRRWRTGPSGPVPMLRRSAVRAAAGAVST